MLILSTTTCYDRNLDISSHCSFEYLVVDQNVKCALLFLFLKLINLFSNPCFKLGIVTNFITKMFW